MSHCWLIGAGYMAKEYARVLEALGTEFTVVARSQESAQQFNQETGLENVVSSMDQALSSARNGDSVIVAVAAGGITAVAIEFLECGVDQLLLEKPAVMNPAELRQLTAAVKVAHANAFVAFNRRYYESVTQVRDMSEREGGIKSFLFEFTEWSDVISRHKSRAHEKQLWIWLNSFHVIDLAFHLGGFPGDVECRHSGKLDWHHAGAQFVGSGTTDKGALFSYCANWDGPGRWGLEFCTTQTRYILRPMEKLIVVRRGSVAQEEIELGNDDTEFKPGLLRQVKAFLFAENAKNLCTLDDQARSMTLCQKMVPYWIN